MSHRRVFICTSCMSAAVAAAALLVATIGNAGTNAAGVVASAVPDSLTTGGQGLVIAKFTPERGGGAASHSQIVFMFPTGGMVSDPVGTSSDCSTSTDGSTVTCDVGTVQPGVTVKRFATFTGGTPGDVVIPVEARFDSGSSGASGGGRPTTVSATPDPELTVVDGTTEAGNCRKNGDSIFTTAISKTAPQQTKLDFGKAALADLPCAWGAVGVQANTVFPDTGAPEISSVNGPVYSTPATLTLEFAKLPVPLKQFVLQENKTDPLNPDGWKPVVSCVQTKTGFVMPAVDNFGETSDACLIGIANGKVIVATLLFRGSNVDPWFT